MQTIIIAGNIGKDAELRQTASGNVASFSVGVSAGRDAATTWYRCSLWGTRGEKLAPYLTKGNKVTVSGSLTAGLYDGKLDLKVNVSDVALQGGKTDGGQGEATHSGGGRQAHPTTRDAQYNDLNDDVPF
jgi:single-strand DNA-binding protein